MTEQKLLPVPRIKPEIVARLLDFAEVHAQSEDAEAREEAAAIALICGRMNAPEPPPAPSPDAGKMGGDAGKRLAEIAAAVEFSPGYGFSFRETGAVQLAADIRSVLSRAPVSGGDGEAVAWQRRIKNTKAPAGHPHAEWSSWKEQDAVLIAYAREHGRVEGYPELEAQVRPLYTHPSAPSDTERMRAEVREAITTLAMLKRNVSTEIAKPGGLFRWEGVPEAIQSRIDALSAALGEA